MNKGNVIIVEDDPDLLENLVEFLMLEGFNVQGVSCVLDFFQTLSISDFDIAIVDIGLPDKSGFEVVKHLRDNTNMGIIILTARDSINDKMMGYDAGTDYYFVKPVEIR
jgi:DNA-binding response OmpR family regulator